MSAAASPPGVTEPVDADVRRTLDGYDAVVYDLDGTLVRLAVDWDAVARDAIAALDEAGIDASGAELWSMLDLADEHGVRDRIEDVIAGHEREGARRSTRLALADDLVERSGRVPVGVCSLNAEAAVRLAMETHGLSGAVREDAVVGRGTVPTHKPDPEPLLETLRRLGVTPERAVFVGDSERDGVTAERAGVDFVPVEPEPSGG
jgi:phosphoglycolate phosphatase